MGVFVYPYKQGSDSAKKIKRILGAKWLRDDRLVRPGSVIVNWGCSTPPRTRVPMLNPPEAVALAANKLKFYKAMDAAGVQVPRWTSDGEEAEAWLVKGHTLVARTKLSSHGGRGIILVPPNLGLPDAKVYTKYVKKEHELRVHVFPELNKCIVHEKRRKLEVPDEQVNWQVRNHNNGFVYANELSFNPPDGTIEACAKAVSALGLTFGAVDVMLTKSGKYFVLEVNTAPGLYGSTKYRYAMYLNQIIMDKYGVDV